MSLGGKRTSFTHTDLLDLAGAVGVKRAPRIVAEVVDAVTNWPRFAEAADVPSKDIGRIAGEHRLLRPPRRAD